MEKVIKLFLVCIILQGCNLAETALDDYYLNNLSNNLYYSEEFDNIDSISDIIDYIDENIEYEVLENTTDESGTIKDIVERGTADCDGISLLFMNIAYLCLDIKCNLIILDADSAEVVAYRSIEGGGFSANHVIVELPNGVLLEPQNGNICKCDVLYRYSFDEIFY